jgi:hypothetical protein
MINLGIQFVHMRITILQLFSVAQSALHRRSYDVNSTLTVAVCLSAGFSTPSLIRYGPLISSMV